MDCNTEVLPNQIDDILGYVVGFLIPDGSWGVSLEFPPGIAPGGCFYGFLSLPCFAKEIIARFSFCFPV